MRISYNNKIKGYDVIGATFPPRCPKKETKVYIAELVNIVFELDKRLNEGKLTEFETMLIANIFKSWFKIRDVKVEVELEDAEGKTKGKQEQA